MKEITRQMVKMYKLNKLGYDFCGYTFNNSNELSYHHLIVPKRNGGEETFENGAILVQKSSHEYLHSIERIDYDMFLAITSEILDENMKGYIDIDNLKRIRDILLCFERDYGHLKTNNGKQLVKRSYIYNRIKL